VHPALPRFLLACTAGSAVAAEVYIQDLRLVGESRPVAFTSAWDDRLGASDGTGEFSTAWAAGVGVRQGWGRAGRPWQLVTGAEALAVRQAADGLRADSWIVRAEAGAAWALRHDLALTLMPALGIGRCDARVTPVAAAALDLAGSSAEAGIRGGLRWQPALHWSLGCEVGWLTTRAALAGDGAALDLRSQGAWVGLSLAWNPDPLPAALDR
jgi:hypothetical protein